MAVLHNYYCPTCDAEYRERWSDDIPTCCDKECRVLITRVNHWEWGGPRTYLHLRDEPFADRAELNAFAKVNDMSLGTAAENVRGSKADYFNKDKVGKIFSGPGMSKKQNKLYYDGVDRGER